MMDTSQDMSSDDDAEDDLEENDLEPTAPVAESNHHLIRELSPQAIRMIARDFVFGHQALSRIPNHYQSSTHLQRIGQLQKQMANNPSNLITLQTIRQAWSQVSVVCDDAAAHTAAAHIGRQLALQMQVHLFSFVRTRLLHQKDDWLQLLIAQVTLAIDRYLPLPSDGSKHYSFDSSRWLPELKPARTYTFSPPGLSAWRQGNVLRRLSMLQSPYSNVGWISLVVDRWRQTTIPLCHSSVVPVELLPSFLLLPCVDAAHRQVSSFIRDRSLEHSSKLRVIEWERFEKELTEMFVPDSSHRKALLLLHDASAQFLVGSISPRPTSQRVDLTNTSTEILFEPFAAFLEELLPLVTPSPQSATRTHLQDVVDANSDARLPFREQAPSRKRLHPALRSGPTDEVDQLAVVRSLLIFRGLTFNTQSGKQHDGVFQTEADWTRYRGNGGDTDESHFVNSCAFGRTRGRHSKNFMSYWMAGSALNMHVASPGKRPGFKATLDFVKKLKLPAFGALTIFLFVEDLAYADLVEDPSLDEFALIVARLKMGARSGIEAMSTVDGTLTVDEAADHFR
ncbi:hypothetical protein BDZ89DRAFT_376498 [Hymenopellis radicata]|nr:hypothetical protein BDZ89DRAFT_376498 [Hymenopellis radicata]